MSKTCLALIAALFLGVAAASAAQTPTKPASPAPAPKSAQTPAKPAAQAPKPVQPVIVVPPRTELEAIAILKKADMPLKDKADACRLLQRLGSRASVALLAPLLVDEKLAHMARYALESIPDSMVDYSFRMALATAKGKLLLGVISSIGVRRDAGAVEPLIPLLKSPEPEIVQATARTLGAIGSATAARALEDAWTTVAPASRLAVAEGFLRCAEVMFVAKQRDPALAIYSKLFAPDVPHQVRTAAIRGLILASNDPGAALLSMLLRANDVATTIAALGAGMEVPHYWGITDALTQASGQAIGDRKILILGAIGKTADPEALPALLRAVQDTDSQVQIAAVRAMAELRNPAAVPALTLLLGDAHAGRAARETLASLPGAEADAAVLKLLNSPVKAQRQAGMELAARRRMKAQIPDLLKALSDSDPEIRQMAVRCLGELGGAGQLPAVLDCLGSASGADLGVAEQALTTLVARVREMDAAAAIQGRLGKAQPSQKLALVRVLGSLGGPQALSAVRGVLTQSDKQVRDMALRTLGAWPTLDAAAVLLEFAKKSNVPAERALALDRYFALATRGGDKDIQERVALCQQAAKVLQRTEEKKQLLGALGSISSPASVAVLLAYLDDASVRSDAAAAVLKAAERLIKSRKTPPEVVRQLVEPLQKVATAAEGKPAERAAELLKQAQAERL